MKKIILAFFCLLMASLLGCQAKELVPTGYENFCWGETPEQVTNHKADFLTFVKEDEDKEEEEKSLHFLNDDTSDPVYSYATEEPYTAEFVFDKTWLCEIKLQLDQDVSPQAFLDAEEKLKKDFPTVLEYEHRANENINFSTHTRLTNGNTDVFLMMTYGYKNNDYGSIYISYERSTDLEDGL